MKYKKIYLAGLTIGITSAVLVHAIDLDMECRASGECQAMEREANHKEGERAWERSQDDNASDRDIERGMEWARDNLS